MSSRRTAAMRRVKAKDIETCRLCGQAIWLEPAGKDSGGYKQKEAWYHVARWPYIACATPAKKSEPQRPLGAGPRG